MTSPRRDGATLAGAPEPLAEPAARRSVASTSILTFLSLSSSAALTAGAVFVLVRTLEPAEYGLFALAFAVNQVAFFFADAGLASASARSLATAGADAPRVAGSALAVKVAVSTAVAALLAGAAPVVADVLSQPHLAPVLRITAMALLLQSVFMLFRLGLNARGAAPQMLALSVVESGVEAAAVAGMALSLGTATGAMAGRTLGYLVGVAVGALLLWRHLGGFARPSGTVARRLMAYGGAVALGDGAFLAFTQVDVLLIGALLTTRDVALFEAPTRLLTIAGFVGYGVGLAVAPRLAGRVGTDSGRELLARSLRYVTLLQGALALCWVGAVAPHARTLFGADYDRSSAVLYVLTGYLLLAGATPLMSLAANYAGRARAVALAATTALAINAAADALWLREHGILVAAAATDVAFAVMACLVLRTCADVFGLPLPATLRGAAAVLAALALPLTGLVLLGTHTAWAATALVPLALVAYVVGLRATGVLRRGDVDRLRTRVRGRRGPGR